MFQHAISRARSKVLTFFCFRLAKKMVDQITEFERLLRPCKDLYALFNFTALKRLPENETTSVIPALFGNYSICSKRQTESVDPSQNTITVTPILLRNPSPALIAYFVVIAVLGLAINLCVIGTICRVRRLWTITNAFVLSLAMADFFMASILVPLNITYKYYPSTGVSTAKDTLFPLLGVASLLNLAAVTLERFMSISYPLTYDAYLNRFRATAIITAVWLLSFLQAFLRFGVGGNSVSPTKNQILYEDLRFALAFVLPCLCILAVNIKIYYVARQHARQINACNPQGPSSTFIKKLKTVKVIALLVGTFMLTWLPYFILSIYAHHATDSPEIEIAEDVTEALVCGTALFNPLLYGLLRKDVREAMVKGVRCQNVNQTEIQSVSYTFRTENTVASLGKWTRGHLENNLFLRS